MENSATKTINGETAEKKEIVLEVLRKPVKNWGCRGADIYIKDNLVGSGTFG
jgi:hypothetical protein